MSDIEWTGITESCITGCTRLSEGCSHCYAEALTATRLKENPKYAGLAIYEGGHAQWTGKIRTHPDVIEKIRRMKKREVMFLNSMSDTFHKDVPGSFINDIFQMCSDCPNIYFQILTKRSLRMFEMLSKQISYIDDKGHKKLWAAHPLQNVAIGVSVEGPDQVRRLQHLAETPAVTRFVSFEPLLGWIKDLKITTYMGEAPFEWAIVGGESGPHARPMHPEWAKSISSICRSFKIPFFFKQWGAYANLTDVYPKPKAYSILLQPNGKIISEGEYEGDDEDWVNRVNTEEWRHYKDAVWMSNVGKKIAGRTFLNRQWDQIPPAMEKHLKGNQETLF